jgi:hypothetical protein
VSEPADRSVVLVDSSGTLVCRGHVTQEPDGLWHGRLETLAPQHLELFGRFEELIDGQVFSLLDDVMEEVERLQLRAQLAGNLSVRALVDVQIFPSIQLFSFRLRE